MSRQIFSYDSVAIDQPVTEKARTDARSILSKDRKTSLRLSIDATHSGVITNGRVYPAKRVSVGFKSFFDKSNGGTSEYNKPILLHHDEREDAVGRVVGGKFTALKFGQDFEQDFLNPDRIGSRGSGVVTIQGIVADPDAIDKIIDGRFLTVSAGHNTDKMSCSICGHDIFDKDVCKHFPGQKYRIGEEGEDDEDGEEFECFAITHNMTYREVSFVNSPAQPPAKVVGFDWQNADSEEFWSADKPQVIHSLSRGKKDIVRELVLCDEDIELSLLTGREKRKVSKTIMTVPKQTVDLLIEALEAESEDQADDSPSSDSDSRQGDTGKETSVKDTKEEASDVTKDHSSDASGSGTEGNQDAEQNVEETDPNKNVGEPNMDKDKETKAGPSAEALTASVEALTKERDSQAADLKTKDEEINTLKGQLETKDAEIKRLTDDAAERAGEESRHLAHSVAVVRQILKKPDAQEVKDRDQFDAFVAKLAERSVESLLDSIADHALELAELDDLKDNTTETPSDDDKSVTDALAGDKVTSPVEDHNNETDSKDASRTKESVLSEIV